MAALSYQQAAVVGATVTMAAADVAGDTIPASSHGMLLVRNGDASSKVVTVVVPGSKYGKARPDITKTVAAGAFAAFGPFPADLLDPVDRLVHVSYDAVTNVTVAAIAI